ncbi:MAG: ABC transporter permease [Oscillospiraceae bacterium]|nr:ABC transporter permease [Oscillospiraceae bacterium]
MFDLIKCAIRNIERKRLHTFLTVLGIAIGIGSVVIIGSIGDIGKNEINNEINSFGVGSIAVTVDKTVSSIKLAENDLNVVSNLKYVDDAVPIVAHFTYAKNKSEMVDCVSWGIDDSETTLMPLNILSGRCINGYDVKSCANVCVVDETFAKSLYKRTNIVGKKIDVLLNGNFTSFEVVGVTSSQTNAIQSIISEYAPTFIYLPYSTMLTLLSKTGFDQIAVTVNEGYDEDDVAVKIVSALERESGAVNAYKAENIAKEKDRLNNVLNIITIILSVIAGISLVVAGLSIMTVMMVSVNERTREIGIKKSIGASKRIIMLEFLCESILISFLGAIIGILSGVILISLACLLVGVPIIINIELILFCIAFAVATGTVFGVYPAVMASKMKPVDALKFE